MLGIDPVFDELLCAELIDQVRFTPNAEYVFHHPLIRAVAYESQLKSDRAQWHRRLAVAIQERAAGGMDENAALIAEHLRGRRRAARGVRLAHARRRVVGRPGRRRRPGQLGAGAPGRRRAARQRLRPAVDAHRAPHHAVCHRGLGSSSPGRPGPVRGVAGVVQGGRGQDLAGHRDERASSRAAYAGRSRRARGWPPNRWRYSSRSAIAP